ncbi:MAG: hypothetical protein AB7I18_11430 [Candidatus Berkiella sp.]
MRQLTTTELNTISGGNDALLLGLGLGFGIVALGALSYPYGYSYYSTPVVTYVPPAPVTTQTVTPGSYNGVPGVWVDTYTYY